MSCGEQLFQAPISPSRCFRDAESAFWFLDSMTVDAAALLF
jgi:hypothetical protein